jgi:tetratricopeptide (TPR) repeat protein
MHLERSLMQKQDARDKGELPPEKYQQFIATFRVELDAVMARVPPNPENKGLHAQILARLGAQERGQALASLEQALADDSENPALLVAKGSILHEQKDFPAAAELARQAWEASGRKDQRAWALLKMSEGRISGARSGEPAAQLRPASDFAKLDWSIPENHDINPQALGLIRQATAARHRFDMPETWRYAQAAMNADPTSHSVQKIYEKYKADQSRHADTLTYVEQAATAIEAGRGTEGVAWAQRAYDRSPSDDTYGILQDVRRRSAELDIKRAAQPPAKAPAPKRSSPLLPIMLIVGAGLMASGAYKIVKSKDTRTSDDGLNPAPYVSPEQARRNYVNSAVLIGVPIVVAGLVYGGPIIWRAVAPAAATALRGGRESIQRVALSEAGSVNPGTTGTVWDSIKATGPLIKGTDIPRSFDILVNGRVLVVHPVATKHFAQHLGRFGGGYVSPATSQAFMASFRGALEKATVRGLPKLDDKIVVDGWEFVLSQWPSQANPVVRHAVYLGR